MPSSSWRPNRFRPLLLSVFGVALGVAAAFWVHSLSPDPATPDLAPDNPARATLAENSFSPLSPLPTMPPYVDIRLACIGDILIHNTVYWAAQTSEGYDFKPQLRYVKPYLQAADLTIANLETTLAGAEQGYAGYPLFNAPDEIASALRDAGVDVLTTANNHCLDQGRAGFFRTLDVARSSGLDVVGTRQTPEEPAYAIQTVKGVKIGIFNFGYGVQTATGVQINGLPLPPDMTELLNFIDYSRLDEELGKLRLAVANARQAGAQILVASMHWGSEYATRSQEAQQRTAQELAALGVDIIFGCHPHVLQEAAWLNAGEDSRGCVVFYSLGNFLSDQRLETVNNIYTEQGLIAEVSLRYYADGSHAIQSCDYLPTWVNKKGGGASLLYEVIPVPEALADTAAFPNLTTADRSRLLTCQETVDTLMAALRP